MKTTQPAQREKFTAGPWAANAIYTKGRLSHWGINGVNIAGDQFTTGRIVDVPRNIPNHDGPTQEANAKLIAAAPELYEACILAKAYADRQYGGDSELSVVLEKAITKVGGQP